MNLFKLLKNRKVYTWLFTQIKHEKGRFCLLIITNMLISVGAVSVAIISKQIIDNALAKKINLAIQFALVFAAVETLQVIASYIYPILRTKLREKLTNHLQAGFLNKFYHLDWLASSTHHTGEFNTYLTNDIPKVVNGVVDMAAILFAFSFQLLLAFGALFYYDPLLALLAFIIGPISVVFSKLWGRKLKRLQHTIQVTESKYMSLLNETLENNIIIKVFKHEAENQRRVHGLQSKRFDLYMEQAHVAASGTVALNIGFRLSFFLAFVLGAYRISIGLATYGTFAAFLQLIGNIQEPIEVLSQTLPKMMNMLASAERLIEYEKFPMEKVKLIDEHFIKPPLGIQIKNLSWRYTVDQEIFRQTRLLIQPGLMVGLVGASGLGKTTLLYILLGLIEPQEGKVELYGENRTQPISSGTRQYLSYVPQGNTLFSGSIYDNLSIANTCATEADMYHTLEIACAKEFVDQLEDGLYTVIGERGVGLSVGQAQRICIARALLNNAPILLLDEATSALDLVTESTVLSNIKKHWRKTCIAITHRPSILTLCEQVYELKEHQFHQIK